MRSTRQSSTVATKNALTIDHAHQVAQHARTHVAPEHVNPVDQSDYGIGRYERGVPDPRDPTWSTGDQTTAGYGGAHFAAGPNIGQMFGYSVNPCITDDDRNDALDSPRRSIDRKKRPRVVTNRDDSH